MYQPLVLPYFRRQLKKLSKKYRHLKEAVVDTLDSFQKSENVHLGHNVYKIRIKTKDIQRGKSKSFRLIVLIVENEGFVVPICIYFKGEREDISKKEINDHLETILLEMQLE